MSQPASGQSDLIRRLADNDKGVRDRAIKAIRDWLAKRSEVSETDMLKIWKGVFYCTWRSRRFGSPLLPWTPRLTSLACPHQVFGCRTRLPFSKNWLKT